MESSGLSILRSREKDSVVLLSTRSNNEVIRTKGGESDVEKRIVILAGLAAATGLILLASGVWIRSSQASVAVIGGADGPTSIFVAARVNGAALMGTGLVVLAAVVAAGLVLAALIRRNERKKGGPGRKKGSR